MEYEKSSPSSLKLTPRLIIHGGAGNIQPTYPPEVYEQYRSSLLSIVRHPFPFHHPNES